MSTKEQPSIFTAEEYSKSFKKNKKGQKEESLQLQVCEYLRNNYPDVIWFCDLASGVKLPIWIAAKNAKMRSSRGLPDLFIAQPTNYADHEGYTCGGLFIELKRESVRLKNGSISKSDHHDEQAEILKRLEGYGYKALFACGYTEAIAAIDEYLK